MLSRRYISIVILVFRGVHVVSFTCDFSTFFKRVCDGERWWNSWRHDIVYLSIFVSKRVVFCSLNHVLIFLCFFLPEVLSFDTHIYIYIYIYILIHFGWNQTQHNFQKIVLAFSHKGWDLSLGGLNTKPYTIDLRRFLRQGCCYFWAAEVRNGETTSEGWDETKGLRLRPNKN